MAGHNLIDKLLTWGGQRPRQVARTIIIYLTLLYLIGQISREMFKNGVKKTLMRYAFTLYGAYKGQKGMDAELDKIESQFESALIPSYIQQCPDEEKFTSIPEEGVDPQTIISLTKKWSTAERPKWAEKMVTGAVYHGGDDLAQIQNEVFSMYSLSNPLHISMWPYLRKMESEIIAMTCDYFNGDIREALEENRQPNACGIVTSGGTESIMLAIRAYKHWAFQTKGISEPQLLIPSSAHAAFYKGCDMMGIEPIVVQVEGPDWTIRADQVLKHLTRNTIAIVGSTPNYPYGTMDPIDELSDIAVKHNVGLHVDCCLGSFLLPTIDKCGLGRNRFRPFDFRCPGVTTISCDTHKYGYSIKGSSVLMFSNRELRRHTYFAYSDWTGGMYSTPTFAGSRSGGIVAATWASLLAVGRDGHEEHAQKIMETMSIMRDGVESIEELELMGEPVSSVFAFRVAPQYREKLDIFKINECIDSKSQWHLAACQFPSCLHLAVTFLHVGKGEDFVRALREAVEYTKEHPEEFNDGSASFYGTAVSLPQSGFKTGILERYTDVTFNIY